MKLQNSLGLLLATVALSACGGGSKDKATEGAVEMAPATTESAPTAPPTMDIIPPGAEGALESATDKAGEMLKEGAEDALDAVKDKAKEAVTN